MIDEEIRQSLQEEFVLGSFGVSCLIGELKWTSCSLPAREKSAVVRPTRSCGTSFRLGPESRLPGLQQQNVLHGDRGPQKSRQRWDLDAVAFSSPCT